MGFRQRCLLSILTFCLAAIPESSNKKYCGFLEQWANNIKWYSCRSHGNPDWICDPCNFDRPPPPPPPQPRPPPPQPRPPPTYPRPPPIYPRPPPYYPPPPPTYPRPPPTYPQPPPPAPPPSIPQPPNRPSLPLSPYVAPPAKYTSTGKPLYIPPPVVKQDSIEGYDLLACCWCPKPKSGICCHPIDCNKI